MLNNVKKSNAAEILDFKRIKQPLQCQLKRKRKEIDVRSTKRGDENESHERSERNFIFRKGRGERETLPCYKVFRLLTLLLIQTV